VAYLVEFDVKRGKKEKGKGKRKQLKVSFLYFNALIIGLSDSTIFPRMGYKMRKIPESSDIVSTFTFFLIEFKNFIKNT
jgi:hypothetical protein